MGRQPSSFCDIEYSDGVESVNYFILHQLPMKIVLKNVYNSSLI